MVPSGVDSIEYSAFGQTNDVSNIFVFEGVFSLRTESTQIDEELRMLLNQHRAVMLIGAIATRIQQMHYVEQILMRRWDCKLPIHLGEDHQLRPHEILFGQTVL